MERPILSLFERRRCRLIIERQPYTPSTVFASFIDSPPRSRRGTSFVSKPLVRTSRGGREPMKIQIPAFLISKRGLSACTQGCDFDVNRVNKAERTRMKKHDLFSALCFIASLLPASVYVSFFLYFEPHDQSFLSPRCPFFPWMHISRKERRGEGG